MGAQQSKSRSSQPSESSSPSSFFSKRRFLRTRRSSSPGSSSPEPMTPGARIGAYNASQLRLSPTEYIPHLVNRVHRGSMDVRDVDQAIAAFIKARHVSDKNAAEMRKHIQKIQKSGGTVPPILHQLLRNHETQHGPGHPEWNRVYDKAREQLNHHVAGQNTIRTHLHALDHRIKPSNFARSHLEGVTAHGNNPHIAIGAALQYAKSRTPSPEQYAYFKHHANKIKDISSMHLRPEIHSAMRAYENQAAFHSALGNLHKAARRS